MADITRTLALRLKLHKVGGTIVHHVALLKRALDAKGLQCEMVKGYCIIEETKEVCDHYWVRVPDPDGGPALDLDVAFQVACLRSPELMALRPVLVETLPQGLTRSDSEEFLIREENRRLFELFQADAKAFWLEAPREVATFPVK